MEEDPLPWDHISCGVTKDFLRRELHRAYEAKTTPDCRQGCLRCGIGDIAEHAEGVICKP